MSDILKFKGPLGRNEERVELELPLSMGNSGIKEERDLIKALMIWLVQGLVHFE